MKMYIRMFQKVLSIAVISALTLLMFSSVVADARMVKGFYSSSADLNVNISRSSPQSTTIFPGQQNVDLLTLTFEASQKDDIQINHLKFYIKNSSNIATVKLYDEDEGAVVDKAKAVGGMVNFNADLVVASGSVKTLTVRADIKESAVDSYVYTYLKMSEYVEAYVLPDGEVASVGGNFPLNGAKMYIPPRDLSIVADPLISTSPARVNTYSNDVKLLGMTFSASELEDLEINNLMFEVKYLDGVRYALGAVRLVDANTGHILSYAFQSDVGENILFNNLNFVVDSGESKKLLLEFDVPSYMTEYSLFSVILPDESDVHVVGADSGYEADVLGIFPMYGGAIEVMDES